MFAVIIGLGGERDWPCTPVVLDREMQIHGWRHHDLLSARAESLLATNPALPLHFLMFKTIFSNRKAQLSRSKSFKE